MNKLMKVALLVMAMCLLLSGCQNLPSINVPFDLPFDIPFLHQHEWQDATCEAPKTCACGATEGEALGHKPGAAATCTADQTCTVCKAVLKKATGHTEETVAGKAATCVESGLTEGKKCSVCGTVTVKQDVIPAKGHTEETLAGKAPTCTETGLTEGKKCSVCGTVTVKQDIIPAKGHTEETVAGKAATCTETGLTDGKKCSVCKATTVAQNEIPATGHSNDGSNRCGTCEAILCSEGNHIEEIVPSKAATCTETGLTEGKKCSTCGDILVAQTETPATGHTEETLAAKAPTCTETGLTEGKKCSVCGTPTVPQNVVPATGHSHEAVVTAPTCTTAGYTTYTCDCGDTYTADPVDATGHSYADHVCTVCGTDDPDHYFVMTIPEALEAKDGKKVEVSGTVCSIGTAWSEQYSNISVTIADAEGNKLYIYRMKTNVALGDIITVQGVMATYNDRQIAAGSTATITGHDTSYDYTEMSITDAMAADDDTNVVVTGTVYKIGTAYSDQYNNISVYIADDDGNQLYLYRLTGNVEVGQIIKVKGTMATYNDARQVAGGTFEAVGTHTCSKYTEATCKNPASCVVCGTAKDDVLANHNYVDGVCSACGAQEGVTTVTASKTMADLITANDWTSSTTKQSFTLDDVVSVKINGGSNTGKAYDGNHIRIYATDSPAGTITISLAAGYELVSIKVSTQTGTYAFLCVDGTTTDISNVSTIVSGSSVVLNSVKNGSNGKQVRVTAIEVVYKAVAAN